jgi:hypothetical protein
LRSLPKFNTAYKQSSYGAIEDNFAELDSPSARRTEISASPCRRLINSSFDQVHPMTGNTDEQLQRVVYGRSKLHTLNTASLAKKFTLSLQQIFRLQFLTI